MCFQPTTITGDSPVVISDLIPGQYTVEIAIADSTEINDTIVKIITVPDNDKPLIINSTVDKVITETEICTSTMFALPTNRPGSESTLHLILYMCMCVHTVAMHT